MRKVRGLRKRGKYYYARYADGTGKMRQDCTKCTNLKDAQVFLEERHRQVREGKLTGAKKLFNGTFKAYAKDYLKWAERQKDYRNKRYIVPKLCAEFGNLSLQKFNTFVIEKYQSKLLSKGLKPSSVNRDIAVIKHMFTKARDWEMIGETTSQQIQKVKQLPVDNKKLRYLTKDEGIRLIETCDDHLKSIVITAIYTGMRKTEIFKLRWREVNLFDGFIQVIESKNTESRQIPMNETLKYTFSCLPRRLDNDYVFCNPYTLKPYTDVKRSFASACKRAKILNCTFHTLRHTFASHLVMAGVDLTTVKELMGHKDIKMTLRYAHLAPKHKADSVAKLNGVFTTGQKLAKIREAGNHEAS